MREIKIGAAQFEHRDGNKAYNLGRIRELTRQAVASGAEFVSFHECAISGYSFLQGLGRTELSALAERIPSGSSTAELVSINEDRAVKQSLDTYVLLYMYVGRWPSRI
jgi:predicted amidohydrolase